MPPKAIKPYEVCLAAKSYIHIEEKNRGKKTKNYRGRVAQQNYLRRPHRIKTNKNNAVKIKNGLDMKKLSDSHLKKIITINQNNRHG